MGHAREEIRRVRIFCLTKAGIRSAYVAEHAPAAWRNACSCSAFTPGGSTLPEGVHHFVMMVIGCNPFVPLKCFQTANMAASVHR